jgi:hypothetical protein
MGHSGSIDDLHFALSPGILRDANLGRGTGPGGDLEQQQFMMYGAA